MPMVLKCCRKQTLLMSLEQTHKPTELALFSHSTGFINSSKPPARLKKCDLAVDFFLFVLAKA